MQFGNLNLWEQQRLVETAPSRNTDPLSTVNAAAVFDLDATITDSYGGSGQTWANLIASPADGELQTAYDQFLGDDGAAATDDPTFTGTAGDAAAYWAFDGGDDFLIAGGNTAWINGWHKTDANKEDFTIIYTGRMADPIADLELIGTGWAGTSGRQGISLAYASSVDRLELAHYGDAGGGGSAEFLRNTSTGLVGGGEFIIGAAFEHATNTAKLWVNSTTADTKVFTMTSSTANAFRDFGAFLGTLVQSCANGTRGYHASGFNKALSDAEFAAVVSALESRHARTYV